ncbi:MAG TPA: 16S rRNA (cytosine(967)-C(5))-methyltransferase, partial [Gammaproteobacteria bacterium]|nr:16S rRNA (cytosine(967)-C(5))-methyltransferase [Gammaproteobacteria bacterium]
DLDSWWDGQLFDRILLDAPCTATGVIRRHPDIKLHRRPSDVEQTVAKQRMLLQRLWQTLAPGGTLLYATCSLLAAENSDQITEFLSATEDAVESPIEADWGVGCHVGRQILPGEQTMDGFYYVRLKKETT